MSHAFFDGQAGSGKPAVLLVNLGTPDAPTASAVRRYLAEFLHDYRVVDLTRWLWCAILHFVILPLRSPRVAKNYARVWGEGGSPLLTLSQGLVDAVQQQLPEARVRLAMRYGNPSVPDVLRQLAADGLDRVLVVPLYPQYSASTSGSVFDAVAKTFSRWRRVPSLRFVADYHLDPEWLDAIADSIRRDRAEHGSGELLLFSFHGLPERFARAGDPYPEQCRAGAQAIAERLGLPADAWRVTFQSRFGREPWLQPYTDATLAELAKSGMGRVDVVCPGFAVDCIETIDEIGHENAELFIANGGETLHYIPCLNTSAGHADIMAALVRRHLDGWSG
ncbi:MAG: ferrochelatase [Xanthomonadaceae bacterium]|nr:ferrochelatase [Xanthomonadaceae bacterium]